MRTRIMFCAGIMAVLNAPIAAAHAQPSCENPEGRWINGLEDPSVLTIARYDPASGALTGTYASPTGTTGEGYPLVGWANHAPESETREDRDIVVVMSFTVRWGPYGSLTAWAGTCRTSGPDDTPTLETLWHLARAESAFAWDHMLTGTATFHPE